MLSREVGKRRSTTWTDIILISDTVRTPRPESTNALKQNQLSPISLLAEHTIFTYTYLCSSMKQWYTTNTRRFAVWLPSKPASRREQEFSQHGKGGRSLSPLLHFLTMWLYESNTSRELHA